MARENISCVFILCEFIFQSNYYSLYIKLIIQNVVNKSIIVQVRDKVHGHRHKVVSGLA